MLRFIVPPRYTTCNAPTGSTDSPENAFSNNDYPMLSRLSQLLTPSLLVRHVTEVPATVFTERGIRAVVTDLDNTLLPWHGDGDAAPEVLAWLAGLRDAGIGVCLASNTQRLTRLARLAKGWNIAHVPRSANKPGTAGILHGLSLLGARQEESAMIGDQLFTDILAGNRLGMFTVLVNPISKQEFVGTRYISRSLERLVLRGNRSRPE
ncbi:MAG: YqeG family HAD IIIA-type phosphatase [Fibrella sp.]|nr:YqeG family HAD IIIA-type phosphatase [Armatimonadota bacterium]